MPSVASITRLTSIPQRQRLILDFLLDATDDITAQDIANTVGTSVRTIRRDLPEIGEFLRLYNLTFQKKAGTGLRVEGYLADRDRLRRDLPPSSVASIRPSDRQAWLACTLLAAIEPVKLHALASDLQITITTAGHDLDALEPWFCSYRLTLQRKRGLGVSLEGAETDRRNAMVDLFFSQFDEAARLALFDETASHQPSPDEILLRPAWLLIAPKHFRATAVLLRELEEIRSLGIEPAERIEFAFHVALLLERVSSRHSCEPAASLLPPLADSSSAVIDTLIPLLVSRLSVPLPAPEIDRLTLLLRGATESLVAPDAALLPLVQRFLQECDTRFGSPLSTDPALLDGLLSHLSRNLQRLRNHLPIRNPLLQEIRENYQVLFMGVRAAAAAVFTADSLPDTEIGFLVLHVGSAIERRRHRRWRALVVCSAGVGTSRMLASRLRTELPEIDIANLLSWQDAAGIDPTAYDIVLSTIPLDWPRERYLVVSPLLQEKDVREITAQLARLATLPRSAGSRAKAAGDPNAAPLDHDQRMAAAVHSLLNEWRVHSLPPHDGPLEALLPAICCPLLANGTLVDASVTTVQLASRVSQSSLVIPGSRLAFLHARAVGVARASITLHRLAGPLIVNGSSIDQCLLMLAPLKLRRDEVAVLSRISSLLMETTTIDTLALGNETATREYLTRQLLTHLSD